MRAGEALLIVEAMKMEHEIRARADAHVLSVVACAGETVAEGDLLLHLRAGTDAASAPAPVLPARVAGAVPEAPASATQRRVTPVSAVPATSAWKSLQGLSQSHSRHLEGGVRRVRGDSGRALTAIRG